MRLQVVDLRTGLPHPVRDGNGRFISKQESAQVIRHLEQMYFSERWKGVKHQPWNVSFLRYIVLRYKERMK